MIIKNCQVEIDTRRGVIYVHSEQLGKTLIRICRLPVPIPDPVKELLDITHKFGVSWGTPV